MFNEYNSAGKHLICDFKEIQNFKMLNSINELKTALREICEIYDFTILGEVEHQFEPIGCSVLFLLSESHLSIHTFPEKNHISFDLYTCRQYTNNDVYNKIFTFLAKKLEASVVSTLKIIDRFF